MIGDKKIVALCISRIQDEASNEYVTALRNVLAPTGYIVFVYNTCSTVETDDWSQNAQISVYNLMDYDIIDAVIVFEEVMRNSALSDMLIERAKEHGKPTIVIGEAHEGCINVKYDHENGFAEAVRHIINVHHFTKLHFMAGIKGNKFSEQRLETFKRVVRENDIPFDDSMVSYGDFWRGPTERETEKIIASGNIPEAIICANDRMAITVCGVLNKHGIRVPEDVAVTGFDGIPEIDFSEPRITSCVTDYGDLADRTLYALSLLEEEPEKTETILVPLRLCVAESCGCHGGEKQSVCEYLNMVNDQFFRFQEEDITLSQIAARIQRCETVEEVADQMGHPIFYDMCCVVEEECFDETVNPICAMDKSRTNDRDMMLLFFTDVPKPFVPYKIPLRQVIPHLDYMLEHERALIFTALHYEDVAMGYVCFFYNENSRGNYLKIPQTVNALNTAIGGYRSTRYKQYLMNQIDEMYRIDTLTGLRNRRGFVREYQKLLESKPGDVPLTVVLADLDGLKRINDNFGHREGDFAIRTVAKALVHVCPPDTLFTRFGGDEMLAVCLGRHDPETIKKAFYQYFEEFNSHSDKMYTVSASIGIYHTSESDNLSFEEIIENADKLMYKDKASKKKKWM